MNSSLSEDEDSSVFMGPITARELRYRWRLARKRKVENMKNLNAVPDEDGVEVLETSPTEIRGANELPMESSEVACVAEASSEDQVYDGIEVLEDFICGSTHTVAADKEDDSLDGPIEVEEKSLNEVAHATEFGEEIQEDSVHEINETGLKEFEGIVDEASNASLSGNDDSINLQLEDSYDEVVKDSLHEDNVGRLTIGNETQMFLMMESILDDEEDLDGIHELETTDDSLKLEELGVEAALDKEGGTALSQAPAPALEETSVGQEIPAVPAAEESLPKGKLSPRALEEIGRLSLVEEPSFLFDDTLPNIDSPTTRNSMAACVQKLPQPTDIIITGDFSLISSADEASPVKSVELDFKSLCPKDVPAVPTPEAIRRLKSSKNYRNPRVSCSPTMMGKPAMRTTSSTLSSLAKRVVLKPAKLQVEERVASDLCEPMEIDEDVEIPPTPRRTPRKPKVETPRRTPGRAKTDVVLEPQAVSGTPRRTPRKAKCVVDTEEITKTPSRTPRKAKNDLKPEEDVIEVKSAPRRTPRKTKYVMESEVVLQGENTSAPVQTPRKVDNMKPEEEAAPENNLDSEVAPALAPRKAKNSLESEPVVLREIIPATSTKTTNDMVNEAEPKSDLESDACIKEETSTIISGPTVTDSTLEVCHQEGITSPPARTPKRVTFETKTVTDPEVPTAITATPRKTPMKSSAPSTPRVTPKMLLSETKTVTPRVTPKPAQKNPVTTPQRQPIRTPEVSSEVKWRKPRMRETPESTKKPLPSRLPVRTPLKPLTRIPLPSKPERSTPFKIVPSKLTLPGSIAQLKKASAPFKTSNAENTPKFLIEKF